MSGQVTLHHATTMRCAAPVLASRNCRLPHECLVLFVVNTVKLNLSAFFFQFNPPQANATVTDGCMTFFLFFIICISLYCSMHLSVELMLV